MGEGNEGNEVDEGIAFAIRPAEPGDLRFIEDSWRRSYDTSPLSRCPGGLPEYIVTQRQVIAQCLKTSRVLVAYPEEPADARWQVMGWICFRGDVVHYLFTKPSFREKGIATALLRAALVSTLEEPTGTTTVLPEAVFTTHGTRRCEPEGIDALLSRAQKLGVRIEYNPALIFGGTP